MAREYGGYWADAAAYAARAAAGGARSAYVKTLKQIVNYGITLLEEK